MRLPSRFDVFLTAVVAGLGLLSLRPRQPTAVALTPTIDADTAIAAWHSELTGEAPADVPISAPREAWRVASRVFWNISNHRLLTEAAAVTFYALLAMFPALAAVISLYGLIATPPTVTQELSAASTLLPGGGMDIVQAQLKNLTSIHYGALSFGAVFGPFIALWSANSGTRSLLDALNVVEGEKESRSYLRQTLISLALTSGGLVCLVIAMAAVVALPIVLDDLGLTAISAVLLQVLRWPVLLIAISIMLDVLYHFGPSRTPTRWRWISWGGAMSAILWAIVSAGFSWYVANFNSFNRTYGALGAVIGFMTWIWISSIIVLIGAELNAALQQTSKTSKAEILP